VVRVGRGRVVLKRFVMRDVVGFGAVGLHAARAGSAQHRGRCCEWHRTLLVPSGVVAVGLKAALEEAPRDAFGGEQVADVFCWRR